MEITIKNLPKSEVEITGEIPAPDFERAFQTALQEFNNKTTIPGFRAGKIPENILFDNVGNETILERAAEISLKESYPKILQKNHIEAIGHPKITLTKLARNNPLGFKAITAILPTITLPDYKQLATEIMQQKEEISVEEKEVDDALEYLQKNSKVKSQKSKPEEAPTPPDISSGGPEPRPEGVGEKPFPLPEMDNEFARALGQSDLQSLKNLLRDNIRQDKERKAREKKRMEAVDKISESTSIDIPNILIEAEKNKMVGELKTSIENMGLSWQKYLSHIKKSETDLRKEWQTEGEKRVRYGLILREIAGLEHIEPSSEEMEIHVSQVTSQYPESERSKIDKGRLKEYAYGVVRNEKVFQLLEGKNG